MESCPLAGNKTCYLPAKETYQGMRQKTPTLLSGLPPPQNQGFGDSGKDGQITEPHLATWASDSRVTAAVGWMVKNSKHFSNTADPFQSCAAVVYRLVAGGGACVWMQVA